MKHIHTISLFLILTLASCNPKSTNVGDSNKKEVRQSRFAKNYPEFNPVHLSEILQTNLQQDSVLSPLYTENKYAPIWVHDTLDTKKLHTFISILNNSTEHGLPENYFSGKPILSLVNAIDSGKYTNLDTLYRKMYELEALSTKAAIKYITGMNYGFTHPKNIYGKKDYDITIAAPDSAFYANLYKSLAEDPIGFIQDSHPKHPTYLKLLAQYKNLKEKENIDFQKIPSNSTYKLGDKSAHISKIAQRLMITGEYTPPSVDSLNTDSTHRVLDKALLAAINTFRRNNSYPEEDEVGKITIEALNRPFSYYLDRTRANMERYRWRRTKQIHDKHIEVNIASFSLAASQPDSLPLIMRVCVGTTRNKTPLLQSDLGYMNLNPVWNVPKSIAQGEVAVLQKRDPTYIKRKNMRLFKGGKEVDPASINWSEVNPSQFSYYIRQDAGYGNSLGLIKFMFNNKFSVYLHDTPSKMAFTRKNRAVSHGCVRVQQPFDLAVFCMSPVASTYKDQVLYSVKKEPLTATGKKLAKEGKLKKLPDIINMSDKISLIIDYYTAYMYPQDSNLYYADDIYGYDDLILKALNI